MTKFTFLLFILAIHLNANSQLQVANNATPTNYFRSEYAPLLITYPSDTVNAEDKFREVLKKKVDELNGDKGAFLSATAYKRLANQYFSRVSSNPSLLTQPSSFASVKFSENNTIADLQSTFPVGGYNSITFGFNGTVSKNVADLYSGKDGINANWGARAGFNRQFWSTIYYYKDNKDKLNELREDLAAELRNKYVPILKQNYSDLKTKHDAKRKDMRDNAEKSEDYKKLKEEFEQLSKDFKAIDSFYKKKKTRNGEEITLDEDKIEEFIDERIADLETKEAVINGYASLIWNANLVYNRKGYTQYFATAPSFSDRMKDTAYNNWGINLGLSYFRFTSWYLNIGGSVGYYRKSNYELDENQKFNRSYTTDVIMDGAPAGTTQYYTSTKKAFDNAALALKKFGSIDVNFQATALFGKLKAFGFNTFLNYSNSSYYSLPNKLDIGFGPVLSLVDAEKTTSKINFSLFGSFRNVFDDNTTANDKFVVSFNVQVPFTFMK